MFPEAIAASVGGRAMHSVVDLLHSKPRHGVVSTDIGATVRAATMLMNQHGIGALVVLAAGRLRGIFTERDVLRRVVAESRSPDHTTVSAVMTEEVICCRPDTSVDEVAEVMRRHRVRHLPVIDDGDDVVGLVSIGDVNASRFASCELALTQMQDYIHRRA